METFAILFASLISAMGGVLAVIIKNKLDYKKRNCIEKSFPWKSNIFTLLLFSLCAWSKGLVENVLYQTTA